MKLIVAGSRTISWSDYPLIETALKSVDFEITEIVSGGARGVDKMGEHFAKENHIPCKVFPADWERFGKAAGYIRNGEMGKYSDGGIVFWDGMSKGSIHMYNEMKNVRKFAKLYKLVDNNKNV